VNFILIFTINLCPLFGLNRENIGNGGIFTNVPVFRASLITIARKEIVTLENWNLQVRFCVPGLKEELSYVSNL